MYEFLMCFILELEVKAEESTQSAESSIAGSVQSCLSLEDISALSVSHQYTLHKRYYMQVLYFEFIKSIPQI